MVSKLLVVVPTLNEASTIEPLLLALGRQVSACSGSSIVVVDGGSEDGTRKITERVCRGFPFVRFLHNPARIQASGINLAVATYGEEFDILVRCDAHQVYPSHFLSALEQSMTAHGADSIVVPMDTKGETCFQNAVAWASDSRIGSGGSAHRGGKRSGFVDHGHHAAIKISAFRAVNGYDETFTHNEDAEFDCRLRACGGAIFLDSEIRLTYQPRSTLVGLWRQYFQYGCGRSRTVRRHPKSLRLRQFLVPAHLLISVFAVLLIPWTLIPMAWPLAYLTILTSFAIVQTIKRKSLCALLTPVAALVMHTGWGAGFLWGWLSIRERTWSPDANVALR
jgi:succinoglycan biosynthesis protein ExoA